MMFYMIIHIPINESVNGIHTKEGIIGSIDDGLVVVKSFSRNKLPTVQHCAVYDIGIGPFFRTTIGCSAIVKNL